MKKQQQQNSNTVVIATFVFSTQTLSQVALKRASVFPFSQCCSDKVSLEEEWKNVYCIHSKWCCREFSQGSLTSPSISEFWTMTQIWKMGKDSWVSIGKASISLLFTSSWSFFSFGYISQVIHLLAAHILMSSLWEHGLLAISTDPLGSKPLAALLLVINKSTFPLSVICWYVASAIPKYYHPHCHQGAQLHGSVSYH